MNLPRDGANGIALADELVAPERTATARIEKGDIDPGFVITQHLKLDNAAHGYDIFTRKGEKLHQGRPETLAVLRKPQLVVSLAVLRKPQLVVSLAVLRNNAPFGDAWLISAL